MKREEILIKDINLKDERFRISSFFSLEKLLFSLKEVGLVNPPLVTYRNHRLVLVSGWKRVLACQGLSLTSIPVWMVNQITICKHFCWLSMKIWQSESLTF